MAKGKTQKKAGQGSAIGRLFEPLVRYLRETRVELRKVHWPTREEAWSLTKVVIAVTVAMAVSMGVLDYLFSLEIKGIIAVDEVAIGVVVVVAVAGVLAAVVLSRRAA